MSKDEGSMGETEGLRWSVGGGGRSDAAGRQAVRDKTPTSCVLLAHHAPGPTS